MFYSLQPLKQQALRAQALPLTVGAVAFAYMLRMICNNTQQQQNTLTLQQPVAAGLSAVHGIREQFALRLVRADDLRECMVPPRH